MSSNKQKYEINRYGWEKKYLNCLWNDGLVADIRTPKGTYFIYAVGDVRCSLITKKNLILADEKIKKGTEIAYVKGDGTSFYHEMKSYINGDKDLSKIISGEHPLYELKFQNNNWLSLDFCDLNDQYSVLDIILDSNQLDGAVEEVLEMIPELESKSTKEIEV